MEVELTKCSASVRRVPPLSIQFNYLFIFHRAKARARTSRGRHVDKQSRLSITNGVCLMARKPKHEQTIVIEVKSAKSGKLVAYVNAFTGLTDEQFAYAESNLVSKIASGDYLISAKPVFDEGADDDMSSMD